jgi:hypothetical protein
LIRSNRVSKNAFDQFKEKKFSSLRSESLCGNLKGKKWKKLRNVSKNGFFINRSQLFIALPRFYAPHIEIMKFCQNRWSLEPHCETSVDPTVGLRRIDAAAGAIFGGQE